MQYAQADSDMSDLREFGATETSARYWRNLNGKLSVCNSWKTSFCGCWAVHLELADKVATFVCEHCATSLRMGDQRQPQDGGWSSWGWGRLHKLA